MARKNNWYTPTKKKAGALGLGALLGAGGTYAAGKFAPRHTPARFSQGVDSAAAAGYDGTVGRGQRWWAGSPTSQRRRRSRSRRSRRSRRRTSRKKGKRSKKGKKSRKR